MYLYEYVVNPDSAGEFKQLATLEHRAPVLDVCFGASDNVLYTAGLDWDVRMYVTVQADKKLWANAVPGLTSRPRHRQC